MLYPVRAEWAPRESESMEYRYVTYVDATGQEYVQGIITGEDSFIAISSFELASETAKIDAWFDTFEDGE